MPDDLEKTELFPSTEADVPTEQRDSRDLTTSLPGASSDVRLANEDTVEAPSFRPPSKDLPAPDKPREFNLESGDKIGDFVVVDTLGRGAFGVVYQARQVSLDRRVALKIAENSGSEGRTMARLEHDHIVQVFSETVDESGRLRLLCMQLVPGASLEAIIRAMHSETGHSAVAGESEWSGADYLAVVDSRASAVATFDPKALHDRELLDDASAEEAAAWVGARLAEALEFAHTQGVLHRDIKPANILVNQYGRPMLADFNISQREASDDTEGEDAFGGTLAFMAPEHLAAFDYESKVPISDVDERSDVYSLGIVIYELLAGARPFTEPPADRSRKRRLKMLADTRRAAPPAIQAGPPCARKTLEQTLAIALAPDKADRFESAERFAAALDGCRELRAAERSLPPERAFTCWVTDRPVLWTVLLIFIPQVIGSVVNIIYNTNQIPFTLAQRELFFDHLLTWYNVPVYAAALGAMVYFITPIFVVWRELQTAERVDPERASAARIAALRLPWLVIIIAALGWLPGGVIFPAALHLLEGPVSGDMYWHFIISFTLSGLIAISYSLCGVQYVVLRILYPRMWTEPTDFRQVAREELKGVAWRLRLIERLAISIPLVAAMLWLLTATEETGVSFRGMVVGLILLGGVGYEITRMATGAMQKTLTALTGEG